MRIRMAVTAIVVVVCMPVARMQFMNGSGSGSDGSRALSTTTVAAIWSHDEPDHTIVLEMLVLIRGVAGWYNADGPGRNGYSFNNNPVHSTNHAFATTGGVTVNIDSDSAVANKKLTVTANLVTIYDQPFAPDSLNVVLVDGADTKSPTVQTELIESRLAGEGDALTRAIRNTPDLLNFIQCDAQPQSALGADPRARAMQVMATTFCKQLH